MKEISLQLKIESNGDIIFSNITDNKNFTIDYSAKKVSAKSIFEAIEYSNDAKYIFVTEVIETTDTRMMEYFEEVKNVITDICLSINTVNFPE